MAFEDVLVDFGITEKVVNETLKFKSPAHKLTDTEHHMR